MQAKTHFQPSRERIAISRFAVGVLVALLIGCSDAKQALVVNGVSDDISSVTVVSGQVESDWGSITAGPVANRITIAGSKAYVVSSGGFPGSVGATVRVIDVPTKAVLNTIPLPDGTNPWAVAVASDTKAYVTLFYGNEVTVLNPTLAGAAAVVGHIALPTAGGGPAAPAGIVLSGGRAFVANSAFDPGTFGYGPGSVSVIDVASDGLVDGDGDGTNGTDTPISIACTNPTDLDADGAGRIHIVCGGDFFSQFGEITVIDGTSLATVRSVPVGGFPASITVAGQVALVADGGFGGCNLYAVRTDTGAAVHTSVDPLPLLATAGYCSPGKGAATPSGLYAYFPAGSFGAETTLSELYVVTTPTTTQITIPRSFDLAPGANLPAAVGLLPY